MVVVSSCREMLG